MVATSPAAGQEAIQVIEQSWESQFRSHITFTISAESEAEIVEARLFYQLVGQRATARNDATFESGKEIEATYTIDQLQTYFPPGTQIEYWWKLTDENDNELKTEREHIIYLDDRYPWQHLSNDRLTLYWYNGREDFGQALFDRANEALNRLESDAGVMIERPVSVFVYSGQRDLLGAISATAQEWTGGQAFTDEGVLVIGISPSSLNWGLRATAHEISHLVIHQATDNPYGDLPRWLDEGLAVYNEDEGNLTFDYTATVGAAAASDSLFTLRTLSSTFPANSGEAHLAYAQSGHIVKYIIDAYGKEKMNELLNTFAEGALYDDALEEVLGTDTYGLDNEWRESINAPLLEVTAPALGIVATEEAAAEANSPAEETASGTVEPAPPVEEEPQDEAVSEAAAGANPTPEPVSTANDTPRRTLACLGGVLPLFALGFVFVRRSRQTP
ncbi:MAG: peptidase MA family metallohydrolase [Anaerolineae bacterium]